MSIFQVFSRLVPMFGLALRSLTLHKLRSFLTVLGLVFGVASVIVMLAIAEGASEEAQQQIESLGVRNIILRSTKPAETTDKKENRESLVLIYGLTYEDLERIESTVPTIVSATPLREFPQEIRYLDRKLEGEVLGVLPEYAAMNNLTLAQGRFLRDIDVSQLRNVCVIGSELANTLFLYDNPLGKSIRVGHDHYYRIIGVSAYKAPSAGAGSSISAQEFNRDVYIPITTDRARFGEMLFYERKGSLSWERVQLSQITVAVRDRADVKPTAKVLEGMLAQFHPDKDYAVTVPLELLERAEETKRIFNVLLGSTAGISLLVGGIGIMNIMLATVTERTREIGIRRALGARRRDIIAQFLIETALLSLAGALLGVALGIATPRLVSWVSGRVTIITIWSPLVALLVAVVVGISFGVYPARRAAMLDPIEALRAE
jgi:putative ABC transport system permease protein